MATESGGGRLSRWIMPAPDLSLDLAPRCENCLGLCCIALPFAASADFALDKPAGTPCPHLTTGCACAIHSELRARGFPGCVAFDCYGAGQRLCQVRDLIPGASRRNPSPALFAAFDALRALHEMLWLLRRAAELAPTAAQRAPVARVHREVAQRACDVTASVGAAEPGSAPTPPHTTATALLGTTATELAALRARVGPVLRGVGDAARQSRVPDGADLSGRDLAGADLRRLRLRGADLRGTLLLGADLRRTDLRHADLLGADLRGARIAGADLTDALFLTPPQVGAAIGDAGTLLSPPLSTPPDWAR